nr:TerB N-terminal domain-containing protein [Pseudonocardia endophytica]
MSRTSLLLAALLRWTGQVLTNAYDTRRTRHRRPAVLPTLRQGHPNRLVDRAPQSSGADGGPRPWGVRPAGLVRRCSALGFLDRFRLDEPPPRPAPSAGPTRSAAPTSVWIPPGSPVDVLDYRLPDGMVFVGQRLRTQSGATEPSLIDPALPVDRARPDWEGDDLFYWPSYDSITPASRAAYLTWLATGRRHPGVPLGYVFLFFYGLERRVLVDVMGGRPDARAELGAIDQEVRGLLDVYGGGNALDRYAADFLDTVALLRDGPDETAPAYADGDPWRVPHALRLGLARFAAEGRPLPAEWALSWSWFHPAVYARTPQTRCPAEFAELFAVRYRQRHGDGLQLPLDRPALRLRYSPASSGLLGTDVELQGVPDLLEEPGATRDLKALVDDVTTELEAYSRHLGRHPEQAGTLTAAALLPVELAGSTGAAAPFLSWARTALGTDASVVVDGDELIGFWPTTQSSRMTKKEVVTCAQLLERHGIGIEPDIRLGGPALASGPVVLFDAGDDPPRSAGPEYLAATTLLQLAVAVSGADGTVDSSEQVVLLDHLGTALSLTPGEVERLIAHLHWLTATGSKLTGLTKRLRGLPDDRRRSMADVLVAVAAADGVISPEEVATLTRIYKLLGLDPDAVYSRLHSQAAAVTGAATSTERHGRRRHSRPGTTVTTERPDPAPAGVVELDPAVLAASAAGTAAVSTLLSEVFADDSGQEDPERDGETTDPDQPTDPADGAAVVPGLDHDHGRLHLAVVARPSWSRAEFTELAERHGLLPDGALGVLNDHAVEICGEPLLEDEGDLVLNDYAVQEIPR